MVLTRAETTPESSRARPDVAVLTGSSGWVHRTMKARARSSRPSRYASARRRLGSGWPGRAEVGTALWAGERDGVVDHAREVGPEHVQRNASWRRWVAGGPVHGGDLWVGSVSG